ncbi:MAG: hypothetical protein HQL15_01210 [Candidatus Omnitrophica bacterium]|nr:hypothetical protein [Candidatus Omnitrophota bacterium]
MKLSALHKDLIRRYLLWAYKTTRESFERIERKTTQLMVDERLLKTVNKLAKPKGALLKDYQQQVEEFEVYIAHKRRDEIKQKFSDDKGVILHPQYLYLKNRLTAIEEAIEYFLGSKELKKMEGLFEQEFVGRILQAREH